MRQDLVGTLVGLGQGMSSWRAMMGSEGFAERTAPGASGAESPQRTGRTSEVVLNTAP